MQQEKLKSIEIALVRKRIGCFRVTKMQKAVKQSYWKEENM